MKLIKTILISSLFITSLSASDINLVNDKEELCKIYTLKIEKVNKNLKNLKSKNNFNKNEINKLNKFKKEVC